MTKLYRSIRKKSKESGAILVTFAIFIPLLMAAMGLSIDLGNSYHRKREMQIAADAGAYAGALAIRRNQQDLIQYICLADVAKNGFDGTKGETRTVNNPPLSGDFAGDSSAVEVIITQPVPTYFMRLFGYSELTVAARGVGAMLDGAGGACIYVLDGNAAKAFEVSSGSTVSAPGCDVRVSSCHGSEALHVTSGSILNADDIDVCGAVEDGGGSITPNPDVDVCPTGRCNQGIDPLASLPQPTVPSGCDHTDFKTSSDGSESSRYQIWPGVYCNGISIESGSHVNFNPGVYILKGGGLGILSGSTAEGTEVGFFNTQGGGYDYKEVLIDSGSETRFSAPTSGVMDGMLVWQDRNIPEGWTNKIESNTNSWWEGTLYFPTQHLMFHSNTAGQSLADWSLIVADTLEVSSNTTVEILADSNGNSPIGSAEPALVE